MKKRDDASEEALKLAKEFGATVRRLRNAKGIAQEEFADRCGLHRTSMSLIERGVHVVNLYTAARIAKGFELSLWELLRELG